MKSVVKYLSTAAAAVLCGAALANQDDAIITFSTTADYYADGTAVKDGEFYALCWSWDNAFDGLTAQFEINPYYKGDVDGVLPVNTDGRGLGELSFDISLKPGLAHGTEIKNRAGIVFDTNDVIMTPTWTNTIDREKPTSRVVDATVLPEIGRAHV